MAAHKREGPSTCLPILGIVIDTVAGELRLPADKLEHLQALLEQWRGKRGCLRKELESLIGLLNHACKVVRSGRSFLRRMIELLHAVPPHQPYIRLNAEFRADLYSMVGYFSQIMERDLLPPSTFSPYSNDFRHRCIWLLGLRCLAWPSLVPTSMGRQCPTPICSRKGIDPHHFGLCSLG